MQDIFKKGFLLPEEIEKVDEKEGKGRKYYIRDIGPVDSVTSVLDKGFPKAPGLIQWFINNSKEDINKKRNGATKKGTRAHKAFEELAKDGFLFKNLSEEDQAILKPIKPWIAEHCPIMRNVESAICYISNTIKTAGRIDLLCDIQGEKWLVDFKTGSGIYPSYEAQVGLYATALDIEKAGILLLTDKVKEGYVWKEVNVKRGFKAFECAYFLANFGKEEVNE